MKSKYLQWFQNNLYYFIFAFITIGVLLSTPNTGVDYFYHVRCGENISTYGIFPPETFSWYAISNNLRWINHEWLGGLILYWFDCLFGIYSCLIFQICAYLCILIILKNNIKRKLTNMKNTIIMAVLFSLILIMNFNARPLVFSFICFVLCIQLLRSRLKYKYLYYLFVTIVWANLHGGSVILAPLLCGYYAFCSLFSGQYKYGYFETYTKKEKIYLFLTSIFSVCCMMIHPEGIQLICYPFCKNPLQYQYIIEWLPLYRCGVCGYFIMAIILLLLIYYIKKAKTIKMNIRDVVMLIICGIVAIYSNRFCFFFCLFLMLIDTKNQKKEKKEYSKKVILAYIGIAIIFITSSFLQSHIQYFSKGLYGANQRFQPEDIQYIKTLNTKRIYNDPGLGSELIYHKIPTFMDGRIDLFDNNIYPLCIDIFLNNSKIITDKLIEKFQFDYIILDTQYDNSFWKKSKIMRLLYKNKNIEIYKVIWGSHT